MYFEDMWYEEADFLDADVLLETLFCIPIFWKVLLVIEMKSMQSWLEILYLLAV